jgi:tyrosyl-tRNA synthetase
MNAGKSLLDELSWRGMVYQHTDGLADALATGEITAYVGFDPTASSLHIGNLVPVMGLVHLQRSGHRPIALVGGGTGMIGDPSGRATERQLMSLEEIAANARAIEKQLSSFLDFSGPRAAGMRDNATWLTQLKAVEFLRDIGKHFTVNYMLAKESVQSRIEGGISFTEFSYMLMQAYDYLELHRREGVTLQMGGSDQWGNITAGMELIRRIEGKTAHALTLREQIESLERLIESAPEKREAQQALARDVTARVHGENAARVAEEVSKVLFGKTEPSTLSAAVLEALSREVPYSETAAAPVLLDALVSLNLAASKSAARRLVEQGGVYVNGQRASADTNLASVKALTGGYHLLRKGARDYGLLRVRGL